METGTSTNKISLLLSETLGTTVFLSCIFYTALYQTNPVAIALGVGGGLFIAITIFGKSTGGHFNPAVSIAYFLFLAENKMQKLLNCAVLLVGQLFGSIFSGLLLYFAANQDEPVLKPDETNLLGSFLDEIFFTFLFLSVIFTVKTEGLAMTRDDTLKVATVCATLSLCVLYGGQISGACYNPAVGIAMNFWASFTNKDRKYVKYVTYYIFAPIIGGLLAGFLNCFYLNVSKLFAEKPEDPEKQGKSLEKADDDEEGKQFVDRAAN